VFEGIQASVLDARFVAEALGGLDSAPSVPRPDGAQDSNFGTEEGANRTGCGVWLPPGSSRWYKDHGPAGHAFVRFFGSTLCPPCPP
jgi:hypothetical protein